MANLWRVLALAWLGGFASPVMTGDPQSTEIATLADSEDPAACAAGHGQTEASAGKRGQDANSDADGSVEP
jgi:hypothetical protein